MDIHAIGLRSFQNIQQRFSSFTPLQKVTALIAMASLALLASLLALTWCRRSQTQISVKSETTTLEKPICQPLVKKAEEKKAEEATEMEAKKAALAILKLEEKKEPIKKTVAVLPEPKFTFNYSPPKIAWEAHFSRWVWPSDLSSLNITVAQQKRINEALRTVAEASFTYPQFSLNIVKSPKLVGYTSKTIDVEIKIGDKVVKKTAIPFNLIMLLKEQRLNQFLLLTNKIIGSGGQRKVKLCYNLNTGEFLVKKQIFTKCEHDLLDLAKKNPIRGLTACRYIHQVGTKFQSIESLYDGNLSLLFGTSALESLEQKFSLIHDIFYGLNRLHGFSFNHPKLYGKKIKLFHFDIKPENILIKKNPVSNKWEGAISDYGSLGDLYISGGTCGYKAPEEVKLEIKLNENKQFYRDGDAYKFFNENLVEEHNTRGGQPMDIWASGLVIVSIMLGRITQFPKISIPPLSSIENCFISYPDTANPKDIKIASLNQEQIDQDLDNLELPSYRTEEEKIAIQDTYKIIREMLQIDPNKRISAANMLIAFQKATSSFGID